MRRSAVPLMKITGRFRCGRQSKPAGRLAAMTAIPAIRSAWEQAICRAMIPPLEMPAI